MWSGYLKVGGLEVGNTARALGYSQTADCPIWWLQDNDCDTVQDAVGDDPYVHSSIESAPWYDPDLPDVSSRFMGVYLVDLLNGQDSTREASITQRLTAGGRIGRIRRATRGIRARAIITAQGLDALEFGSSWLDAVLAPGACGAHGDICGTTDMEFFADCPPPRRMLQEYSAWSTKSVNLHPNPSVEGAVTSSQWSSGANGTGGSTSGGRSLGNGRDGGASYRKSWTVGETAPSMLPTIRVLGLSGSTAQPVSPSTTYTASVWFRASRDGYYRLDSLEYDVDVTTAIGRTSPGADFFAAAGEWVRLWMTVTTLPTTDHIGFNIATSTSDTRPTGTTWDADQFLLEQGQVLNPYFDGATVDDDLNEYSWAGTANASSSIHAVRSIVQVPEGDETYFPYIDTYRRFFHSVKCTSGPFTIEDFKSTTGDYVGKLVEFTITAEVPWMYGIQSQIDIPPIVPTVVQDIAYNLAPYPSAELPGPAMVAATNYSTNPSVETNTTGWVGGGLGVTPTPLTSRSTELASVGLASFKVACTTTNSGTAGTIFANQDVDVSAAPAGARFSVNMWAAAVLTGGTAVLGTIEIKAEWLNASNTVVGTVSLGTEPAAGGALTAKSLVKPATATKVRVSATLTVTSWSVGAVIALYADALAVTVP